MTEESLADFISGEQPSPPPDAASPTDESAPDGGPIDPSETGTANDALANGGARPAWRDTIAYDSTARLPEFDTSFAEGYAGQHEAAMNSEVLVLVGTSQMPFRMELKGAIRAADKSFIMPLLEAGPVRDPKSGAPVPALCYLRPKGNALVESTEIPFSPMRDELIIRDVITPVVRALEDLQGRRVFHGRINPANLFRREGPAGAVQLGDCMAGPPGYDQPLAFETLSRCMTEPVGRGTGSTADDLYALGVTIAVLCLGVDPFAQFPSEVIVEKKLAKGSYAALVGQKRIPSKLMEPVRGLLADDAHARWQLSDISLWLSGRRLSPRQATTPKRASRPIRLGEQNHSTVKSLANAVATDVPAAITLLDSGQLEAWVRRTIGDEDLAEAVDRAVMVGGSRAFRDERKIARLSFVLDNEGPIRYRGRSLMPDGIGWAMAEAISTDRSIAEIADFIESGLVVAWFQGNSDERANKIAWSKAFERHRTNMTDQSLGMGIERCLYDLNPDLQCQSPLLVDYFVSDVTELMKTLDQIASRAERPADLIDRHIAAFIMSRGSRISSQPLRQMSQPKKPSDRAVALLTLLADLQEKTGVTPLSNLAGWMVSQLEPVLDELYSQKLRQRIKDALVDCVSRGSLSEMLVAARNREVLEGDKAAFAAAHQEYWRNEKLARRAEAALELCRDHALITGHQFAAVVSGLLAVASLATVVLHQIL